MKTILATFLTGSAILGIASAQSRNMPPVPDADYASYGSAPIGRLHGVNLGNMLEAPHEGAWGETVQEAYFSTIKQAGFTLIRVPIRWAAHVSPAPDYTIDPAFFSRVDWVVAQAEKNN